MQTDELTGLPTHNALNSFISEKYVTQFCIAYVDIDSFIYVNDQYGWLVADNCLVELAEIIKHNIQHNDIRAFRIGGEEFLLVDSECDSEKLSKSLRDIQQMVVFRKLPFKGHPDKHRDRLSISVAISNNKLCDIEDLKQEIQKLYHRMNNLKCSGIRNFNVFYDENFA